MGLTGRNRTVAPQQPTAVSPALAQRNALVESRLAELKARNSAQTPQLVGNIPGVGEVYLKGNQIVSATGQDLSSQVSRYATQAPTSNMSMARSMFANNPTMTGLLNQADKGLSSVNSDNWWVPYVAEKYGVKPYGNGDYYLPSNLSVKYENDQLFTRPETLVNRVGSSIYLDDPRLQAKLANVYQGDKSLGSLGLIDYRYVIPEGKAGYDYLWSGSNGERGFDDTISGSSPRIDDYVYKYNISPTEKTLKLLKENYMTLAPNPKLFGDVKQRVDKYFIPYDTLKNSIYKDEITESRNGIFGSGGLFGTIASLVGSAMGLPMLSTFGSIASAASNKNPAGILASLISPAINKFAPELASSIGSGISNATGGLLSPGGALNTVTGAISGGISGGAKGAVLGGASAAANDLLSGVKPTGVSWLDNAIKKGAIKVGGTALAGGDVGYAAATSLIDAASSGATNLLDDVIPDNIAKLVSEAASYAAKNELNESRREEYIKKIQEEIAAQKANRITAAQNTASKQYERIPSGASQGGMSANASQFSRIGQGMLNKSKQPAQQQLSGMMRQDYGRIGA